MNIRFSNSRWLTLMATGLLVLTSPLLHAQFGPAKIAVSPVVQREIEAGQAFVGSVMPVRTSVVGAPIGGRVEIFSIKAGDRVTKGQPIAKLRTRTIELELAAAKAEYESRKQELTELENGARPDEIEMVKAKVASTQAMAQYHRARESRFRNLLPSRGATPEEVQEATAGANQAEAAAREARAALRLLEEGPRKEKIANARAKAQVAQEEANRIQDQLEKHTIVAPFDGYVSVEHTEVGQWVIQGAHVAEIVELDQVDVEFHVLEDYIAAVHKGMSARVELGALAEPFVGEVNAIVPKANLRARTFPVKVRLRNRIDDSGPRLKAGMIARAVLPVGPKETALLVPKDALVLGGPSPVVFVADVEAASPQKGKARLVPVQLGVAAGGLIQVKGDLKPGAFVVVQGNERLRPGQDVEIARTVAAEK